LSRFGGGEEEWEKKIAGEQKLVCCVFTSGRTLHKGAQLCGGQKVGEKKEDGSQPENCEAKTRIVSALPYDHSGGRGGKEKGSQKKKERGKKRRNREEV